METADLPALPEGVSVRGATMDDVAAAVALTRAAERDEGQDLLTSVADIAGDWARPSMDLATDVVLVTEHAEVIAYAEQFGGRAFVHVHPQHRGRGIGTMLAAWSESHARERGLARVGQSIAATATTARALLTARGYEPRWESWVLKRDLDDLNEVRPPAGVTIRPLRRPDDDQALYEVIDAAFSTWPDRDPSMAFEDWRVSFLDRADDLDLVLVAEQDGQVVGAALGTSEDNEGWIEQLAVDPDHWGRGIAGALLKAEFARFAVRRFERAALSTDSRTGALGLYEHVGMTVTESFTRFSLPLPPTAPGTDADSSDEPGQDP